MCSPRFAKKEPVTIVLRCVDPKESAIHEYFLTFVEAASLDAEGLTKYIVDTLKKHQLDLACIITPRRVCGRGVKRLVLSVRPSVCLSSEKF